MKCVPCVEMTSPTYIERMSIKLSSYRPLAVGVVMTSRFSCRHIGVHVALHTYLVLYPTEAEKDHPPSGTEIKIFKRPKCRPRCSAKRPFRLYVSYDVPADDTQLTHPHGFAKWQTALPSRPLG